MNIRIGLSGSGGTGKTTLLTEVNKELKLPVIEEGVRRYMEENGITHLRELGMEGTMKMQLWLLQNKKVTEGKDAFIADRTTVDNAIYALYWLGREDKLQRGVQDYVTDCVAHAYNHYDLVFIAPWGAIPLEDDGIRSAKPMYQLAIQSLIENIYIKMAQHEGGPVVHMLRSISLEDRVKEVLNIVEIVSKDKASRKEEGNEDSNDAVRSD